MPEATYVPPEQQSAEDLRYMREALAMAQEAFDAAEIPVGSVFVRNGAIIAKARNRTNELMNVSAAAGVSGKGFVWRRRTAGTSSSSSPCPSSCSP